ncbi:phage major tail protein, phi13 family [Bellilinea caldifistulae]|uniref:major tail protein n=1 Tax=Bellilinea caldifistulae TaxID=360411 RepID=UPI000785A720|nr:major tail protein [Bellilinea caldifistulae]GAP11744.1 phage major tail protein, phi13 family [Bellilinea caldifistulae]
MANPGEYKSKIGLSSLYVAEVTQDDALGYAADTPEYLAPAAEASQEPTTSFEIQYADDQPYDVMTSEGDTKINLTVTGMPIEMLAKITGRVFDPTTGRMFDNAGVAPYFALSFRSLKSNGKYRYYQYLKGKFDMPKEETATKGEKPEPKTLQLTFTAIKTVYKFDLGGGVFDSVKRVVGDEDTTNFNGANWFNAVQVPGVGSISALALMSSVPLNDATGVSVSANLTLTFNNALKDFATSGVVLLKSSDGTVITTSNSLDATKKIITIDPTSNLTASTNYLLTYAVMDIYGQTLNGAIQFTTA